jgi:hypothetical protein
LFLLCLPFLNMGSWVVSGQPKQSSDNIPTWTGTASYPTGASRSLLHWKRSVENPRQASCNLGSHGSVVQP